jgi:hypothetical protein
LPGIDKKNYFNMFGFLEIDGYEPGDSDKLGSKGRFSARIQKFRDRNAREKRQWKSYRDRLETYPTRLANYEERQEQTDKKLRKPRKPSPPLAPTMRFIPPVIEHHFWWLTHNILAHTLIGLIPVKWFFDFHDWTSKKLNAQ